DEAASPAQPPSRCHLGNPPSITSSSHRRSSKVVTFFAVKSQLFVEASKANATTRQPPAISTTSERGKEGEETSGNNQKTTMPEKDLIPIPVSEVHLPSLVCLLACLVRFQFREYKSKARVFLTTPLESSETLDPFGMG
ncbi:hypothetical protein U1Q18_044016, partial [Sarracenia purpurea var. burkii]